MEYYIFFYIKIKKIQIQVDNKKTTLISKSLMQCEMVLPYKTRLALKQRSEDITQNALFQPGEQIVKRVNLIVPPFSSKSVTVLPIIF